MLEHNYLSWLALLITATIGISVSLWGYYQIINIPPPTTLEVSRPAKTIQIYSPTMNETIKSPVKISGQAKTETGYIIIKLMDRNGLELASVQAPVGKEEFTPFETEIKFKKPDTNLGLIKITQHPLSEGALVNTKNILVIFAD